MGSGALAGFSFLFLSLGLSLPPSAFLPPSSLWVSVPYWSLSVVWHLGLLGHCCGDLHLLLSSVLVYPEALLFRLLP